MENKNNLTPDLVAKHIAYTIGEAINKECFQRYNNVDMGSGFLIEASKNLGVIETIRIDASLKKIDQCFNSMPTTTVLANPSKLEFVNTVSEREGWKTRDELRDYILDQVKFKIQDRFHLLSYETAHEVVNNALESTKRYIDKRKQNINWDYIKAIRL